MYDEEIEVGVDLSEEYKSFEEFCSENVGREAAYLEMVSSAPLEMDPVTLAFCLRHQLRFSQDLMDKLLKSLSSDAPPALNDLLALKGIQLDKTRALLLRDVVFSFRDSPDEEIRSRFVRALQLMTMTRDRRKFRLNLGEAYSNPEEGWMDEDFGGDESLLETVRAIEDPTWTSSEEK